MKIPITIHHVLAMSGGPQGMTWAGAPTPDVVRPQAVAAIARAKGGAR